MKNSVAYKNSKLASYLYISFNVVGILASLAATYFFVFHWLFLTPILIYSYYLFKLLKRVRDNEVQLEIGDEGIYMKESGVLTWHMIDYAVLRSTGHPSHELDLEVNLLKPDRHGKSEYKFDCVPLNVHESKIRDVLNAYGKEKFLQV